MTQEKTNNETNDYLELLVKKLLNEVLIGKKNTPRVIEEEDDVFLCFSSEVRVFRSLDNLYVKVKSREYKLFKNIDPKVDIPKNVIELNQLFDSVLEFSNDLRNNKIIKKEIIEAFEKIE